MLLPYLILIFTTPFTVAASSGVTVLFQNDGNWTSHADKPSALLIHGQSGFDDAAATCKSHGESLLGCDQIQHFNEQLTYQKFAGNLQDDELFWSGCNQSSSNHSDMHYSLCTNSAPMVDKVDTNFSVYPRINVSENGGTSFQGLRDHMAFRFLGIPFAQPPVGGLRLKHAQPWQSERFVDATQYSASCMQFGNYDGNSHGLNPWGNSEDCLYLNIFTPTIPVANKSTALKPVLFWIHGGAQTSGTGVEAAFDGASLVSRSDVVVVTINYRVNIFGYLSLDEAIPGNFAMSDKIAALQWVKDHIFTFGGNPGNVTIFGQSAGGGSVIDLITSPRAEGLFKGAVIQSGGKGWSTSRSNVAASIEPYIRPLCNGTGTSRLNCLQALPADTLLNLTSQGGTWSTVIDNNYTLDTHIAQVAKGRQSLNPVQLMMGFMPEEAPSLVKTAISPNLSSLSAGLDALAPISGGAFTQELADAILDSGLWLIGNNNGPLSSNDNGSTVYPNAYNATISIASDFTLTCGASQFASVGAASNSFESMWVYSMERAYPAPFDNPYGLCSFPVGEPNTPYYRCHSGELFEVFGSYHLYSQPVRVPEDIYFTNAVQDMWASFARTGNPNVDIEFLEARGYKSTIGLFQSSSWTWPEFSVWDPLVASLQYPQSSYTTLPEQQHCNVLLPFLS